MFCLFTCAPVMSSHNVKIDLIQCSMARYLQQYHDMSHVCHHLTGFIKMRPFKRVLHRNTFSFHLTHANRFVVTFTFVFVLICQLIEYNRFRTVTSKHAKRSRLFAFNARASILLTHLLIWTYGNYACTF